MFEASQGLHGHWVLCCAKCQVKQAILFKMSGQIFTRYEAQILHCIVFFLLACIHKKVHLSDMWSIPIELHVHSSMYLLYA